MIPQKAQDILDFWLKETPSEKRFQKDIHGNERTSCNCTVVRSATP